MTLSYALPYIVSIVSCEDVGPCASFPATPVRCFARRCSITFLVVVTVKVTGRDEEEPEDFQHQDVLSSLEGVSCLTYGLSRGEGITLE
jgi:hypothetical protein